MARIAFLTESLPTSGNLISQFSWSLIRSLADQHHEIRIFSTWRPDEPSPPSHPRIEILRPFRRWNWLEIPRALPLMIQFQPDVVHVVHPHREAIKGWTNAMSFFLASAPLLGAPVTVASFFDIPQRLSSGHRTLISSSDLVTVCNDWQKERLETQLGSRRPLVEVLPVTTGFETDEGGPAIDVELDSAAGLYFQRQSNFVFFPGNVDEQEDPALLLDTVEAILDRFPGIGAVIGGGWGNLPVLRRHEWLRRIEEKGHGSRLLVTGPLSRPDRLQLMARAEAVFLSGLPNGSLQLTQLMRESLQVGGVTALNSDQANLDPLPWKDEEHALIAGKTLMEQCQSLGRIREAPEQTRRIRDQAPEFVRSEAIDHSGNALNRLYSRLLASKPRKSRPHPFGPGL